MLVKKINPEWQPSEKPDLEVGKTLEMTNARELIIGGDAIGIDEATGAELSAFELYGVIVEDELEEFRKFQAIKKQEFLSEKLEAENKELIKEAAFKQATKEVEAEEAKKVDAVVEGSEEVVEEVVAEKVDNSKLSWNDLKAKARDLGVYNRKMKKDALLKAVNNA